MLDSLYLQIVILYCLFYPREVIVVFRDKYLALLQCSNNTGQHLILNDVQNVARDTCDEKMYDKIIEMGLFQVKRLSFLLYQLDIVELCIVKLSILYELSVVLSALEKTTDPLWLYPRHVLQRLYCLEGLHRQRILNLCLNWLRILWNLQLNNLLLFLFLLFNLIGRLHSFIKSDHVQSLFEIFNIFLNYLITLFANTYIDDLIMNDLQLLNHQLAELIIEKKQQVSFGNELVNETGCRQLKSTKHSLFHKLRVDYLIKDSMISNHKRISTQKRTFNCLHIYELDPLANFIFVQINLQALNVVPFVLSSDHNINSLIILDVQSKHQNRKGKSFLPKDQNIIRQHMLDRPLLTLQEHVSPQNKSLPPTIFDLILRTLLGHFFSQLIVIYGLIRHEYCYFMNIVLNNSCVDGGQFDEFGSSDFHNQWFLHFDEVGDQQKGSKQNKRSVAEFIHFLIGNFFSIDYLHLHPIVAGVLRVHLLVLGQIKGRAILDLSFRLWDVMLRLDNFYHFVQYPVNQQQNNVQLWYELSKQYWQI